jgi:hypothetical protein
MASIFTIAGRLTGKLLKQPSVAGVVRTARQTIYSEIQLSEIRLRLAVLKKKRKRHHTILGRVIFRLISNNVAPFENPQVNTTLIVLREIDLEIEAVEGELTRKIEEIDMQKTKV